MKRISSLAAFFLVIGSSVAAPVISPVPNLMQEPQHATASKRIANYFTREHYVGLRIDDELSAKVFDRYLKSLDFFRNVLLKSDVDSFEKYRNEFDNALAKSQFDFAYQMFNLSLTRRVERYDYAISLLDKPFDFTSQRQLRV